jgi:hypothetical protein
VSKGLRAERRSLNCKVKLPSDCISSRRKALQKELTCDVATVVIHNCEPFEKPRALLAVDEQVGGDAPANVSPEMTLPARPVSARKEPASELSHPL